MRIFLCSLLTLLTGMILGAWGPKADLRRANAEIEQLQKQAHSRKGNTSLDGITAMLRIPENGAAKPSRHEVTVSSHATIAASSNQAPVATVRFSSRPRPGPTDDDQSPPTDPQTLQERLRIASEVWKARADLARSGFVSNVTTSEVQSSQFDLVVADMNLRLGTAIREWVDTIKEQKDLTPETGIRMMSALSGELVQTYDQLDAAMPADWRQHAGDKFQVFDLIDPQVAMPLTEIEGKMQFHPVRQATEAPGVNP